MPLSRPYKAGLNERLKDPEYAAAYLNAAQEDGVFLLALRDVAEVHRIGKVAKAAGVNRESLYRALSTQGNPTRETLGSILEVLGLEHRVAPKGSVPITPTSGAAQYRRRSYRAHRRAKKQAHVVNQLTFPFPRQIMPVLEAGNFMAEAVQINSVGTGQFGTGKAQSVVSGLYIQSSYLNQEQNESMTVPIDLLVAAASTGAGTVSFERKHES
jgi:probable addiction module antidote protein